MNDENKPVYRTGSPDANPPKMWRAMGAHPVTPALEEDRGNIEIECHKCGRVVLTGVSEAYVETRPSIRCQCGEWVSPKPPR